MMLATDKYGMVFASLSIEALKCTDITLRKKLGGKND